MHLQVRYLVNYKYYRIQILAFQFPARISNWSEQVSGQHCNIALQYCSVACKRTSGLTVKLLAEHAGRGSNILHLKYLTSLTSIVY